MPSVCSAGLGGGGGGSVTPPAGFTRDGNPLPRLENVELRDRFDDNEVLSLGVFPVLLTLVCVTVLLCAIFLSFGDGTFCECDVLGLLSPALPSKGPGAIVSMRFITLSPPFMRGLRGA